MADMTPPREGEILLYTGSAGGIRVEVLFEGETFWLTQKRMAELFEVTVPTAFSRTGDPSIGEFEDAVILGRYGETPDDLVSFTSMA